MDPGFIPTAVRVLLRCLLVTAHYFSAQSQSTLIVQLIKYINDINP